MMPTISSQIIPTSKHLLLHSLNRCRPVFSVKVGNIVKVAAMHGYPIANLARCFQPSPLLGSPTRYSVVMLANSKQTESIPEPSRDGGGGGGYNGGGGNNGNKILKLGGGGDGGDDNEELLNRKFVDAVLYVCQKTIMNFPNRLQAVHGLGVVSLLCIHGLDPQAISWESIYWMIVDPFAVLLLLLASLALIPLYSSFLLESSLSLLALLCVVMLLLAVVHSTRVAREIGDHRGNATGGVEEGGGHGQAAATCANITTPLPRNAGCTNVTLPGGVDAAAGNLPLP